MTATGRGSVDVATPQGAASPSGDLPMFSDCAECDVNELGGSRTCSEHPDGPTFSFATRQHPNAWYIGDEATVSRPPRRCTIVAFIGHGQHQVVEVAYADGKRVRWPFGALRGVA